MRTRFVGSLSLLLTLATLSAGEFKLPDENPLASVTIPATWKPSEDEQGVEAISPDEEVYINLQPTSTTTAEKAIDEALTYLKDKGVSVASDSAKKQDLKLNGMEVYVVSWNGTDEDGACVIRLSIIAATKNQGLLLIYWASPEGEKANQRALDKIVSSIKPWQQ